MLWRVLGAMTSDEMVELRINIPKRTYHKLSTLSHENGFNGSVAAQVMFGAHCSEIVVEALDKKGKLTALTRTSFWDGDSYKIWDVRDIMTHFRKATRGQK